MPLRDSGAFLEHGSCAVIDMDLAAGRAHTRNTQDILGSLLRLTRGRTCTSKCFTWLPFVMLTGFSWRDTKSAMLPSEVLIQSQALSVTPKPWAGIRRTRE